MIATLDHCIEAEWPYFDADENENVATRCKITEMPTQHHVDVRLIDGDCVGNAPHVAQSWKGRIMNKIESNMNVLLRSPNSEVEIKNYHIYEMKYGFRRS